LTEEEERTVMAHLVRRNTGEKIELGTNPTLLGRLKAATLCLDNETVSRRHCMIKHAADGYVVVDLDSVNGTYVNGKRVKEKRLADGDVIQVGNILFVFKGEEE